MGEGDEGEVPMDTRCWTSYLIPDPDQFSFESDHGHRVTKYRVLPVILGKPDDT